MSPILFHVLPFLLLGLSVSVCFVDKNPLAGYRYPSPSAMPMMGMVQLAFGYWDAALRMSMAIGVTRFSSSLPILSLLYLLHPAPVSADLTYLPDGSRCGSCTVRVDFKSYADIYKDCSEVFLAMPCPQDCAAKTPPDFTNPLPLGDGKFRVCGSQQCIHICAEVKVGITEVVSEVCCFGKDSVVGYIHCFFL